MTPNLLTGGSVWLFLSGAVVQVSILILVAICGTWLLRYRSAAVRHGVLFGTLIAVLVVPVLSLVMQQSGTEIVDLRDTAWKLGLRDLQSIDLWRVTTTHKPETLSSAQLRSALAQVPQ